MDRLEHALQLERSGHFILALRELEHVSLSGDGKTDAQVLKAGLLERLGRHAQSRAIAMSVLSSRNASARSRARCECILGRLDREKGAIHQAIERFQKAAMLAGETVDLQCLCWAHLFLMLIVSQRAGPEAATPLVSRARATATKLGEPHMTATLHMFVSQMEAYRGLLDSADRHATLALELIQESPNLWIEALSLNTRLAVAILTSDYDRALKIGERAVEVAQESGAAGPLRACLGNLGNLNYAIGDFDRAVDYFERALAALPSEGENANANLDSLAKIRLTQDRLAECESLLDRIDTTIRDDRDWRLYPHRCAALTRAQLLVRSGRSAEGLEQIDFVLELADRSGDPLLSTAAMLVKAQALGSAGYNRDVVAILRRLSSSLRHLPAELYAEYEGTLAFLLLNEGKEAHGEWHRSQAQKLHEQLQNVRGSMELAHTIRRAVWPVAAVTRHPRDAWSTSAALQTIVSTILNSRAPRIAAAQLVDLIESTGSVYSAAVTLVNPDRPPELVAHAGNNQQHTEGTPLRYSVRVSDDQKLDVSLVARDDVESVATLNAVDSLIEALNEINASRAERDRRKTLWPTEELTFDERNPVVTGHMRETMVFAQRVARATITVLITGESGTGKEILARSIHDCSDRASKPFVPFNCASVPPHLLESQLFGHRRGAFTGADHDYLGVIRTARDGTLFLDEIGELSLDLQPKLLRFLESGEISPLGEPTTSLVNVRIVAATNRNLEDAVREGRFREDLFYRINVIRLSIKPLRERRDEIPSLVSHFVTRAAKAFQKGHVEVAEETMERLLLYRWPGNVRQLHNEISRMVALVEPNAVLQPDMISDEILSALPLLRSAGRGQEIAVPLHDKLMPALRGVERQMIAAALREHEGKVDAAAKALGISRKGLYLKRQRLGV